MRVDGKAVIENPTLNSAVRPASPCGSAARLAMVAASRRIASHTASRLPDAKPAMAWRGLLLLDLEFCGGGGVPTVRRSISLTVGCPGDSVALVAAR
jgi:hypothetical protein